MYSCGCANTNTQTYTHTHTHTPALYTLCSPLFHQFALQKNNRVRVYILNHKKVSFSQSSAHASFKSKFWQINVNFLLDLGITSNSFQIDLLLFYLFYFSTINYVHFFLCLFSSSFLTDMNPQNHSTFDSLYFFF